MEQKIRKSLLQLLQEQGRFVSAPCGGHGKCGKCVVRFLRGATEATARDEKIFTKEQIAQGFRLACLSYPEDGYEVELPDVEEQIVAEVSANLHMQETTCSSQKLKNQRKIENLNNFVRQEDAVQIEKQTGMKAFENASKQEEAESTEKLYGIAIDIGTTTIAGLLIDLKTGSTVAATSMINHQRAYGADVLSRIQASVNGKRWEMQRCIRQDLKQLVDNLITEACHKIPETGSGQLSGEKNPEETIKQIVIAGNTTMCHLLRGFSCEKLGVAPFVPVDIGIMKGTAADMLGMRNLSAEVTILPGFSAFVGADIAAGAAMLDMGTSQDYNMLLDIGTNGEMVLGREGSLFAASTSAGPAFEGGNIVCGMASVPGAISHVKIDADKNAQITVIGVPDSGAESGTGSQIKSAQEMALTLKRTARGICGSGMIDLYAELIRNGMIDEYGTYTEAYFEHGYHLTERVRFTQNDIRELQMAKAAIRAGIEILMQKASIKAEDIDRCYLAGGFGSQIDIVNAAEIGLIPEGLTGKTVAAGNTSLEGARCYLLGKVSDEQLRTLKEHVKEVNLANDPQFNDLYIQYM